jgi:hypothetical protein
LSVLSADNFLFLRSSPDNSPDFPDSPLTSKVVLYFSCSLQDPPSGLHRPLTAGTGKLIGELQIKASLPRGSGCLIGKGWTRLRQSGRKFDERRP